MYGPLRFFHNNFLTQDMMTLSSWEDGRLSGTRKTGSGVALNEVTGPYEGPVDLTYNLEIDSVAGGVSVGESTFKWKNSESSGWEETGVLTRTTPAYALSADGLSTNLEVSQTGRTGDDFALADNWQWAAEATYGRERLLDRNRMTWWQSNGLTENIVFDLGSAMTPTAFFIHDHNLTSGASVTLEGNTSDSWSAPPFSMTFSSITDPLYYYFLLTGTYQYWRLVISDATNPDGYIKIANAYLGTYTQLLKVNADWTSSATDGHVLQSNTSESGVMRRYSYAKQRTLQLNFGNVMTNTDIDTILDIQDDIVDADTRLVIPLWVHLFQDEPEQLRLHEWQNMGSFSHSYFAYLLNSGVTMNLPEVVKV